MATLRRLVPVIRIWLTVIVVWALFVAARGSQDEINIPWLVTIVCWACLDFSWALAPRRAIPTSGVSRQRVGQLMLTILPHALYCLPLSGVPMLGQRWIPRLPLIETAGVVMCLIGVVFATWARLALAANWSGDVAIASEHALIKHGPYAIVRHPIYLGLVAAQTGMMLALGEARVLVFVFGIERLVRKAVQEDDTLRTAYPTEYGEYERRVKRLVPWIQTSRNNQLPGGSSEYLRESMQ